MQKAVRSAALVKPVEPKRPSGRRAIELYVDAADGLVRDYGYGRLGLLQIGALAVVDEHTVYRRAVQLHRAARRDVAHNAFAKSGGNGDIDEDKRKNYKTDDFFHRVSSLVHIYTSIIIPR